MLVSPFVLVNTGRDWLNFSAIPPDSTFLPSTLLLQKLLAVLAKNPVTGSIARLPLASYSLLSLPRR